jgi:hypothetical protein
MPRRQASRRSGLPGFPLEACGNDERDSDRLRNPGYSVALGRLSFISHQGGMFRDRDKNGNIFGAFVIVGILTLIPTLSQAGNGDEHSQEVIKHAKEEISHQGSDASS